MFAIAFFFGECGAGGTVLVAVTGMHNRVRAGVPSGAGVGARRRFGSTLNGRENVLGTAVAIELLK